MPIKKVEQLYKKALEDIRKQGKKLLKIYYPLRKNTSIIIVNEPPKSEEDMIRLHNVGAFYKAVQRGRETGLLYKYNPQTGKVEKSTKNHLNNTN